MEEGSKFVTMLFPCRHLFCKQDRRDKNCSLCASRTYQRHGRIKVRVFFFNSKLNLCLEFFDAIFEGWQTSKRISSSQPYLVWFNRENDWHDPEYFHLEPFK